MSAPGLTSPIRSAGFDNLQLNAGVFILNFDHSSITTATALKTAVAAAITAGTNILGMTNGGGTFTIKREVRTPEVDGRRYAFKGDKFVDFMDGYLSGTLKEVTPDNVKRVMGTADIDTTVATKTVVSFHTAIDKSTDYITKICWVGDLADGRLVVIEIDNAFNTADFSLTFTDKSEGTIPFEFHAHQGDVLDYDQAPCRIYYFSDAA